MPVEPLSRHARPTLLFGVAFFLGVVLLTLACQRYDDVLRHRFVVRFDGVVQRADYTIRKEFFEITGDMAVLSKAPTLKLFLETPTPEIHARLGTMFESFAVAYERYARIELIDADGQERLVVEHAEGESTQLPDQRLVSRADTPFYREALAKAAGQVHVAFVNKDGEERVRLGAPVIGTDLGTIGLLVLEYPVTALLANTAKMLASVDKDLHGEVFGPDGELLGRMTKGGLFEPVGATDAPTMKTPEALLLGSRTHGTLQDTDSGVLLIQPIRPLDFRARGIAYREEASRHGIAPDLARGFQLRLVVFIAKDAWLSGSMLHAERGQVVGLMVVLAISLLIATASSNQLARRALVAAERERVVLFEDLYDNAPFGYLSLDDDGRIVRCNRTIADWLRRERSDLLLCHFRDLVTVPFRPVAEDFVQGLREGRSQPGLTMDLAGAKGPLFRAEINARIQRDDQGAFELANIAITDRSEEYRLQRELERRANTDPLTDVFNRRGWRERVAQEWALARQDNHKLSLLFADLDHFKDINDRYGHEAGDDVLKVFAKKLHHTLREVDVVARTGGEEFAALLPDTSHEQALQVAERVRAAVAGCRVTLPDDTAVTFTVSIGVASLKDSDTSFEDLMRRADARLYEAKRGGRDRVQG